MNKRTKILGKIGKKQEQRKKERNSEFILRGQIIVGEKKYEDRQIGRQMGNKCRGNINQEQIHSIKIMRRDHLFKYDTKKDKVKKLKVEQSGHRNR